MIILNTSTMSLQIVLSGAAATNELPFVCSYVDLGNINFTGGLTDGTTTDTIAVTVIPSPIDIPYQRQLKFLSVYNTDTTNQLVTVQLNDNGTILNIFTAYLGVGYTLVYNNDKGFEVYDNYGRPVTSSGTGTTGIPFTFTLSCADEIWQPQLNSSYVLGTRYGVQPAYVSSFYLPSSLVPSSLIGNYFGFFIPNACTIKSVSLSAGYINTSGVNTSAQVYFTKNNISTYLIDGNINFNEINYQSENNFNVLCGQGDYINATVSFANGTPPIGMFVTLLFYCD